MTLSNHPIPGTILRVDLSQGFAPPEMVKRRPAIVLSPPIRGRQRLCTIVPLSTTPPTRVEAHHLKLRLNPPLPKPYDNPEMWVKGDIVLTVAFHRLRFLFAGQEQGQRIYDIRVLDPETLEKAKHCVRAGLGL